MPLFLLSLILQVALIVHVMKTGRNTIWIWVVMMPIVGPVSYFLVEVLPELLGTRTARRAGKVVQKAIDPDRGLRQASAAASLADTVDAKIRLAAELQERSEFAAAIEVYRQALRGLYEHDPNLMLGLARAQFGAGEPGAARATLDALIAHNPDFNSPDGHLLYARALVAEGDAARAEGEYRALVEHYPGAEATVRFAAFLRARGRDAEGSALLRELLRTAELVPKHARQSQAHWLAIARRELGA